MRAHRLRKPTSQKEDLLYLASTHEKISLLKPCHLYSEVEIKACSIFFCRLRKNWVSLHHIHPVQPPPQQHRRLIKNSGRCNNASFRSIIFLGHFVTYNKGSLTTHPHPQSFCCYTLNCSVTAFTGAQKGSWRCILRPAAASFLSPQKKPCFGGPTLHPGIAASHPSCQDLPCAICVCRSGKEPLPGLAAQYRCSHRDRLGREDTGTAQALLRCSVQSGELLFPMNIPNRATVQDRSSRTSV